MSDRDSVGMQIVVSIGVRIAYFLIGTVATGIALTFAVGLMGKGIVRGYEGNAAEAEQLLSTLFYGVIGISLAAGLLFTILSPGYVRRRAMRGRGTLTSVRNESRMHWD